MPINNPQKPLQSALVFESLSGEIQEKALIIFTSLCPFVFTYQAFRVLSHYHVPGSLAVCI